MPDYHTQPTPTWRNRFTERERPGPGLAGPIANCRQYADNNPAGLPGHHLMLIIARLADTLDTLPLQSVAEPIPDVLSSFFDEKWEQGKLSELWTEEDEAALLQGLSPELDGNMRASRLPANCERLFVRSMVARDQIRR